MLALLITVWVWVISAVLLFFGGFIFQVFGITLDAFRVGTGALLFLTSVSLVQGHPISLSSTESLNSLAAVPMAMPIALGPASIGVLMVYGGEITAGADMALAFLSITLAIACVGVLLFLSNLIQRAIGKNGLVVLSKLTGLVLAALSAQMIFSGIGVFITEAVEKGAR